jgi:hypothetical protein
MPIFDRYIAVDWSANNGPKTGRDSIWIAEATPAGVVASRNPATRARAMSDLEATLLAARARGERVLCGFDFAFGFPKGTAERFLLAANPHPPASGRSPLPTRGRDGKNRTIQCAETISRDSLPLVGRGDPRSGWVGVGEPAARQPWQVIWSTLAALVEDSDDNISNRFDVAETLNAAGGKFWGHPHGRSYAQLTPRKPAGFYDELAERRAVEAELRGPQPVWKLTGVGAVGSQTLLGIPRLEGLRHHPVLGPDIAVWPFETDFERKLNAPIVLAEIYPSLLDLTSVAEPRDRAQVETCVRHYADLDAAGLLTSFLAAPSSLGGSSRDAVIAEEGWIAGVGHPALCPAVRVAA